MDILTGTTKVLAYSNNNTWNLFQPKVSLLQEFYPFFVSLTKIHLRRGRNKFQMTGKGHEEGMDSREH